jgi:hypothetical protein
MPIDVRLRGLQEGVQALHQLRDGAGRFNGPLLRVGSDLVYAWGIETGRTKGGRLARRAGPAHYLRGGLEREAPRLKATLAAALDDGVRAVDQAVDKAGKGVVEEAQRLVPVRSGRLRGSIRAIRTGR